MKEAADILASFCWMSGGFKVMLAMVELRGGGQSTVIQDGRGKPYEEMVSSLFTTWQADKGSGSARDFCAL